MNPDESDDYVYIAKSKDHVNPSTQVNILNEGVMKKGDKFQSLIKLQTLINSDLPLEDYQREPPVPRQESPPKSLKINPFKNSIREAPRPY